MQLRGEGRELLAWVGGTRRGSPTIRVISILPFSFNEQGKPRTELYTNQKRLFYRPRSEKKSDMRFRRLTGGLGLLESFEKCPQKWE